MNLIKGDIIYSSLFKMILTIDNVNKDTFDQFYYYKGCNIGFSSNINFADFILLRK